MDKTSADFGVRGEQQEPQVLETNKMVSGDLFYSLDIILPAWYHVATTTLCTNSF